MNYLKIFLLVSCLSFLTLSFAQDEKKGIHFLEFSEMTAGLSSKEIDDMKEIFDQHKVIDLEKSNLTSLQAWFGALNQRLTDTIEKKGQQYPFYKIYVLATPEVDAYIYKYKPSGQQFYKGHVFISTGMLEQFASSIGKDISEMDEAQLKKVVLSMQGVMAHEFAHPKEDELVKWDMRGAQDRSRQNHAQLDEMATDIMGMRTLRDSKLEPESLYMALDNLSGKKAERGSLMDAAQSTISTHPEMELRLNMIRGSLTNTRMEEGAVKVETLAYDFKSMKDELSAIVDLNNINNIIKADRKAGETLFSATLRTVETFFYRVCPAGECKEVEKRRYLKSLDLLGSFKAEELTPKDIEDYLVWIKKLEEGEASKILPRDIWGMFADINRSPLGRRVGEIRDARIFQRKLRKMNFINHPDIDKYFNDKIATSAWDYAVKKEGKVGVESFTSYLPQTITNKVIRKALSEMDSRPDREQVQGLFRMWAAIIDGNSPQELEKLVVDKMKFLLEKSDDAINEFSRFAHMISQNLTPSIILNERFVRVDKTTKIASELLSSYNRLFQEMSKHPEMTGYQHQFYSILNPQGPAGRILMWHEYPDTFLRAPSKETSKQNQIFLKNTLAALESPKWKVNAKELIDNILKKKQGFEILSTGIGKIFLYEDNTITDKNYYSKILDAIIESGGYKHGPELELLYNSYYTVSFYPKRELTLLSHIFKKGYLDHGLKFKDFIATNFYENLKKNIDGPDFLYFLKDSEKKGFITTDEFLREISSKTYLGSKKFDARLISSDARVDHFIWEKYRKEGVRGESFLKKIQEANYITDLTQREIEEIQNESARGDLKNSRLAGLKYSPEYAKTLSRVHDPIMSDYYMLLTGKTNPTPVELHAGFKKNLKLAQSYIQNIFNPDNKILSVQFRNIIRYDRYDKLAQSFIASIPSDLSSQDYLSIWKDMSSKRANRHTDQLFDSHLKKDILAKGDLNQFRDLLATGAIKSESLKLSMVEKVFEPEIKLLSKSKGNLNNLQVNDIIQKIVSYIPDSSRFRDDYLEKIAWKLQLQEAKLNVFVEPLKSFNFKTIDQNTVNMMSAMSSLSQRLTQKEKIDFIKYIQSPEEAIEKSLPRVDDLFRSAVQSLPNYTEEAYIRMRDNLESMIRDAGDNERLILIENLVGSRGHGLWYNETSKKELFKLAKLEGTKLSLLQTYLKALPPHEHSIVVSYLLASSTSSGDTEILRIMEMFQTPGLKFAQMSAIFSLFGEEESKKLASAKSRAKPPTRAAIYEILKERLSVTEYKKIKSVDRLLGSGSIKYVVSVTFEDGSKKAIYIRRPYIEESIETTLNIADDWLEYLKKDPEFADSLDYDYYISSLRQQLEEEIKFVQEAKYTNTMAAKYESEAEYKGWKFKGVRAIQDAGVNNENIHYYTLVEDGVMFDDLDDTERKIVSEYIINTEVKNIFSEGDADRHLGNFLFDRKKKIIYPLDMGQYFKLEKSTLFKQGQTFHVARMIQALSLEDKSAGAKLLVEVFEKLKTTGDISAPARAKLLSQIETLLKDTKKTQIDKVLGILAELNKAKVRLPFEVSLGVIKGMSIVFNEDYAKVVGPAYVEAKVKAVVTKEIIKGQPAGVLESVKNWFGMGSDKVEEVVPAAILDVKDCNIHLRTK